jgi:hypothetical protein
MRMQKNVLTAFIMIKIYRILLLWRNSKMSQDSLLSLEKIVALSKRRGFIYPTSDIYGGLAVHMITGR